MIAGISELSFQTPLVLTGFCYLSGMAMFLSVLFWQWNLYRGRSDTGALGKMVGLWLLRILVAVTLASLAYMIIKRPDSPVLFVPEISLLLLITALYLMTRSDKSLAGLLKALPAELLNVAGVTFACLLGWTMSVALGWMVFEIVQKIPGSLDSFAVVVIGLLWNAPLVLLYSGIQEKSRKGIVIPPDDLKFHKLLWPVLAAYLLIMLPEFIELVANAPKIHQMIQAGPPLQRV